MITRYVLTALRTVLPLALVLAGSVARADQAPVATVPLGPFRTVSVIDGDSVVVPVAGGLMVGVRVRLAGIDTPEINGRCDAEKEAARAAANALRLLAVGGVALVTGLEVDRYGRLVGRLFDRQGRDLSMLLISAGHARPYDGRGARQGWCP